MASGYRTQSSDTSPEVEALLIAAYRRMTPAEKLDRVWSLRRAVHERARVGIRLRHPEADEREVDDRLVDLLLGVELASRVRDRR